MFCLKKGGETLLQRHSHSTWPSYKHSFKKSLWIPLSIKSSRSLTIHSMCTTKLGHNCFKLALFRLASPSSFHSHAKLPRRCIPSPTWKKLMYTTLASSCTTDRCSKERNTRFAPSIPVAVVQSVRKRLLVSLTISCLRETFRYARFFLNNFFPLSLVFMILDDPLHRVEASQQTARHPLVTRFSCPK